jgi:hypothetical protein
MQAFEYVWVDFSKLEFDELKLLLADYSGQGWEMVADAPAPPVADGLAVMLARPLLAPELRRAA